MKCKTIAITNQKGGVGKTTTAVSLSAALNYYGKKVLIVDYDPQGSASISLGLKPSKMSKTIYEAMVQKTKAPCYKIRDGYYITPANIKLVTLEQSLSGEKDRLTRLKTVIEPLKAYFDFICIDCPPSFGLINASALIAADYVIAPVKTEALSLEGLREFRLMLDEVMKNNSKLELLGILLVQYKGRIHHTIIRKIIETEFKGKVFDSVIRENISLAEAPYYGKDIFTYAKRSIGAADYAHLAYEVIRMTSNGAISIQIQFDKDEK